MKKTTLILAIIAIFGGLTTSCKKYYSCQCTTIYSNTSGSSPAVTNSVPYSAAMKKSQAEAACAETQQNMYLTNAGATLNGLAINSTCEVR